ncbi:MAG: helix-turn-helix domain-containing protein [Ignavibacteriaceae bacterium]
MEKTLIIKNMVCGRCIKVVKEELEKLGLNIKQIQLGEVLVEKEDNFPLDKIRRVLEENGFELLEDKRAKIIEQVKVEIIKLVQSDEIMFDKSLSEYLTKKIGLDYHYITTLFSSVENITIEQFFILQKVERAKELLKYGELTLSEIAYTLGYSSVQHLSNQFKKVTGLTASKFKSLSGNLRNPLDHVQ